MHEVFIVSVFRTGYGKKNQMQCAEFASESYITLHNKLLTVLLALPMAAEDY